MLEKLALIENRVLQSACLEQGLFCLLALGHVPHGQDQQLTVVACLELASVEQHHPAADDREGVLELEVVEDRALGDDVLEQGPQVGDVPLAVAQLVDESALGLIGRDVKRLVEGAVGGADAERGVEDQQGLAHRVNNVLGVVLNILNEWCSFHTYHPSACFEVIHWEAVGSGAASAWFSSRSIGRSTMSRSLARPSCTNERRASPPYTSSI